MTSRMSTDGVARPEPLRVFGPQGGTTDVRLRARAGSGGRFLKGIDPTTTAGRRRIVGIVFFLMLVVPFTAFNGIPKLDERPAGSRVRPIREPPRLVQEPGVGG